MKKLKPRHILKALRLLLVVMVVTIGVVTGCACLYLINPFLLLGLMGFLLFAGLSVSLAYNYMEEEREE
jgi:hypothetical protein